MDILALYNEIFEENGTVKPCGREKCITLIKLLSEKYPDISFGNEKTGFMNVENINQVIKK